MTASLKNTDEVALAEAQGDYATMVSALCTLAFGECIIGRTGAAQAHARPAV